VRELRDRVAVVTGAASGIGRGIADAFAGEGMRLVLADVDGAALAREAARIATAGAEVEAVVTDVGDAAAVEALGRAATARFGDVHLICNNAGIIRPGRSWELPLEDWERVLRVNLLGVVHGVRTFVPLLLEAGAGGGDEGHVVNLASAGGGDEGHVVNVASMAAVVPVPGLGPYNAAKHGVLALSECLHAELAATGAPIGVTVVMPGRVRTTRPRSAGRSSAPCAPTGSTSSRTPSGCPRCGPASPASRADQRIAARTSGRRISTTKPAQITKPMTMATTSSVVGESVKAPMLRTVFTTVTAKVVP
jgi:NAD(P)-dependent dehydrogenase (short-subunit alcohol dehydrogenase family)